LGTPRTHGVYAIQDRGDRALEGADRSLLMELEDRLGSPEGIGELQRRRAALALIMVGKIEQHVESEVASGTPIQDIPILKAWPAFQNAAGRALKAAKDTLPKNGGNKRNAELEHIRKVVGNGKAVDPEG